MERLKPKNIVISAVIMGLKVTQWRKDFADIVNAQLEQIGSTERVSHLSYADLGNGLEATQHEGYEVTQQRRRYEAEQQK
jgi:hypothetical protein